MVRQIINKKQSNNTQAYHFNGRPLMFNKQEGYTFSDHPNMDSAVDYFLSLDGFELTGGKKKEKPKQDQPDKQNDSKKENKGFFSKKEKKTEEPVNKPDPVKEIIEAEEKESESEE